LFTFAQITLIHNLFTLYSQLSLRTLALHCSFTTQIHIRL
jgi:hypothetical protein